jgi:acetyl esterase/lipase
MFRPAQLAVILLALGTPTLGAGDKNKVSAGFEVEIVRDLAYYTGPDADGTAHKLDLYLPRGHRDFPVLFFVHGGSWRTGDKNFLGIFGHIGKNLARRGIGLVSINYRLTPRVKHPEHVKDVARAFAWTWRNIIKYGGRQDELFVAGHSAGGHLIALLTTDPQWLKAEGVPPHCICGAVSISGALKPLNYPIFTEVFGSEPDQLHQASPIAHVRPGLPPFLLLYAEQDLPGCDGAAAEAFCKALHARHCEACMCCLPRNHVSILWNAIYESDPVHRTMHSFIVAQVLAQRLSNEGFRALDSALILLQPGSRTGTAAKKE